MRKLLAWVGLNFLPLILIGMGVVALWMLAQHLGLHAHEGQRVDHAELRDRVTRIETRLDGK